MSLQLGTVLVSGIHWGLGTHAHRGGGHHIIIPILHTGKLKTSDNPGPRGLAECAPCHWLPMPRLRCVG